MTTVALAGCGGSREQPAREPVSPQGNNSAATSDAPAVVGNNGTIVRTPLAKRAGEQAALFSEVDSRQSGVDFVNPLEARHADRRLYHSGFACGGVAIGDVDGNGLPDLYFTNGPRHNRLFLQQSPLRFEDGTIPAGLQDLPAWSCGASLVDIDNDADLDIYVCNYDTPNRLYLNNGQGKFREAAAEFDLDLVDACLIAAFCDYDGDGDLDLYLLTNRYYRRGGRPRKPPIDLSTNPPRILPEFSKYYGFKKLRADHYGVDATGRPDRLLRNEGDGTFRDVSTAAGIYGVGHGLSATWWDYNGDGWSDLYVANDFDDPDRLYRNNGDGTFDDVLAEAMPHTSWFSMGADFADLDGDGRFDLLVADMSPTTHLGKMTTMAMMSDEKLASVAGPPQQVMRNTLFLNTGTPRFLEAAELTGLAHTDWTWTVLLDDFDNDRLPDVLVTNGMSRSFNNSDVPLTPDMLVGKSEWDHHEHLPSRPEANFAFRNRGNLRFENVSKEWGFDKLGMSYAAARGDLDRDGDLDVVVINLDEEVSLYRNDTTGGNALLIRLRGTRSNSYGLGAKVEVTCNGKTHVDQLSPYTGYLSSNEPVLHVGLGAAERVDKLVIRWPSGVRQEFTDIQANMLVEITEPATSSDESGDQAETEFPQDAKWFLPSDRFAGVSHSEKPFDDFQQQPLLPRKLSQLGPGIAVADIDGDGDDDVYLGGAAGTPGKLLISEPHGVRVANVAAFTADRACEDMGALWLDVEGDNDLDLYVVSGGVESGDSSELLRDRLYLNDGHGNLSRAATDALPDVRDSGSCAVAADFDRDGDIDLFVGSRVIPGKYPLSPTSRLLRNNNGRFEDVTDRVAPELAQCGLVTGALWSDCDGDGRLDLLVTTEWGPVRLFRNDGQSLREATAEAGLDAHTGWWNAIVGRDLDGDGDIDYVATNFGENTLYHPTPQRPIVLFYGDFQETGQMSLVEAEYENGTLVPIRDRYAVDAAMPLVGARFPTHREFGEATLSDIYTPQLLETAHRFEARTLASSVLLNDGKGRFNVVALPAEAQLAPAFGAELADWNGDGMVDLYLVGNLSSSRPAAGPMRGGVSVLLAGNGDGQFTAVPPTASGLVVPGDARSLVRGDFNGDRKAELLVGVNNGRLVSFDANAEVHDQPKRLRVELIGDRGNRGAIGAGVVVRADDDRQQAAEIYGGNGYLSQSTSVLEFAPTVDAKFARIDVTWPDGSDSTHAIDENVITAGEITIKQEP